ncbi:sugar 3-C-methyl transferase [Micromonospora sp. ATCC 39149]|uniref:Class I SAM-dependent methyltransferase n=1 Tax=Micromonospora carbonacea TaxID=47853 RepID=A0A7D6C7Z2_9ACTN|nr:class I SAM-dependent methyltransferase [Micromonospora sp. ATCC 39149]EEP73339.1 sugar 3-C-methyl transferase [Micromonospora sp. ATCC 39149]QLJ99347.1 class I SAM-dependent methyltransferase [Micromonospora carbonacea]
MTDSADGTPRRGTCRACGGTTAQFLDLGRQPLSDRFLTEDQLADEFFFHLAVGVCAGCTMVQLMEEVPREEMFHQDYPYHSSGSSVMQKHFADTARHLLEHEATGPDPFVVEIGCNDGVMLRTVHEAGVRHLGFEPSGGVADVARGHGVRVVTEFFEESTARRVRETDGPADVIFAANTICHIPYLDSILRGVDALLAPDGVFVFEDPYLGDILDKTSFDQIYDEHFFFFSARSVQALAARFGFALVDVERLPVHGGEVRYTIARAGARQPAERVAALIGEEDARGVADRSRLDRFAADVEGIRTDLLALLNSLKAEGKRVVAYGATAKSATVTNFCGIGPDLVSWVCDTTPAKQGRLTPGTHIPVRTPDAFTPDAVDYALLFAWNHADEIMAKEQEFRRAGGQWILYVPRVHVTS